MQSSIAKINKSFLIISTVESLLHSGFQNLASVEQIFQMKLTVKLETTSKAVVVVRLVCEAKLKPFDQEDYSCADSDSVC